MRILVAGAGIAGLASAIALRRAGHDVVIYERAGELREIGAALSLWPNALAALEDLGVGEQIRPLTVIAPTGDIRDPSGRTLVKFRFDAMERALNGLPVVVHRADLQKVLVAACRDQGIEIGLGRPVREVRADGSGVTAETGADTGREDARFDAVIGADGINSAVRVAVVAGDGVRDCRRLAWRAVVPDPHGLIDHPWLSIGVELQLIASPAPHGTVYWAADTPPLPAERAEPPDLRAVLRRFFGSWHAPIPELLDVTPAEVLIINHIYDRRPPKRLCRGPVLLVGDAAHAMTPDLGQGACQAIEDAAVLGHVAAHGHRATASELFSEFERRRLRHVRTIVRDSYEVGRLAVSPGALSARVRNRALGLIPEWLHNRRLATYASAAAYRSQL